MHGARPMLSFALVRGRERFATRERPLELDSRGVETVQLHSSTVPVHRSTPSRESIICASRRKKEGVDARQGPRAAFPFPF